MHRVEVQTVYIEVGDKLADVSGPLDEILTLLVGLDLFLRLVLVVVGADVPDLGIFELLLGHVVIRLVLVLVYDDAGS